VDSIRPMLGFTGHHLHEDAALMLLQERKKIVLLILLLPTVVRTAVTFEN